MHPSSTLYTSAPTFRSIVALALSRQHRAGAHAKPSAFTAGTMLAGCGLALAITAGALTFGVSSGGSAEAAAATGHTSAKVTSSIGEQAGITAGKAKAAALPAKVNGGNPIVEALPDVVQGPVTGGTVVTITGANLDKVMTATVGGQTAFLQTSPDALTLTVPVSAGYAQGQAPIELFDASGAAVPATTAVKKATAGAPIVFTYAIDQAAIANQINYVMAYWSNYNPAYIQLDGVDCANFTSQALLARGWSMDGEWGYDPATGTTTASWISSTALRDYMAAHPERAVSLGADRAQVKVGDVAQFDWDDSGDPDHTATVTAVENTGSGIRVLVGGHTKDIDYWDVDEALATGGGSVTFWSIH